MNNYDRHKLASSVKQEEAMLERVKQGIFEAQENGDFQLVDELTTLGLLLTQKLRRLKSLLNGPQIFLGNF